MSDDQNTQDIYSLSDEELLNMSPEQLGITENEEEDQDKAEDAPSGAADDGALATEGEAAETGAGEGKDDDDESDDLEGKGEGQKDDDSSAKNAPLKDGDKAIPEGEKDTKPDADTDKEGAKQEKDKEEIDYKAVHDRILAPFRANGKEMRVESVDEAVALMQMGANYNKKMAALKPNLKLLKLLENNGLLSEEKLSFYIDLEKKNPEAIKKLIKDSGLDPLDMDVSTAGEYKPHTYTVDDRELDLDAVLDEIQDTPTYRKVVELVSNKWDGPSKQVIAQNPQLLKVLNDHMAHGYYDKISSEIERERMFGRLTGMSDIEAYKFVGDAIQARGGFDTPAKPAATDIAKPQPKPKAEDPKLKERKRAASSTSATAAPAKDQDFNPLALSDEAFSKLINEKLL